MQQAIVIIMLTAAVAYLAWRTWREVRGVARYGRCHGCALASRCHRRDDCKTDCDYAKVHPHH